VTSLAPMGVRKYGEGEEVSWRSTISGRMESAVGAARAVVVKRVAARARICLVCILGGWVGGLICFGGD